MEHSVSAAASLSLMLTFEGNTMVTTTPRQPLNRRATTIGLNHLRRHIRTLNITPLSFVAANAATRQKMLQHKALLEQRGVDSLSTLGTLRLSGNVIPMPGLLRPQLRPTRGQRSNPLYGREVTFHNVLRPSAATGQLEQMGGIARLLNPEPLPTGIFGFTASVLPIPYAYWAATEIILEDNTTVIFTGQNRYLTLLAEKIQVGNNVAFTWEEPEPDYLPQKPPRPVRPGLPPRPNRNTQVRHGRQGRNGQHGGEGPDGTRGPELEFWTLDLQGSPLFELGGQDGWPGADGGDGGHGGHGARGFDSSWNYLSCTQGGSGGNGGNGGHGGNGGNGGNGGDGGKIAFYMPQPMINQYSTGFYVDVSAGQGGQRGRGGQGGSGGQGGAIGRSERGIAPLFLTCSPRDSAAAGRPGQNGNRGQDGAEGQRGEHHGSEATRFTPIDPDAFRQKLLEPAIKHLNPSRTQVGETVQVHGDRFSSNDQVFLNGQPCPTTYVSDGLLSFQVPSTEGGRRQVTVRRPDSDQSNRAESNGVELLIVPQVDQLLQAAAGQQLVPGQETRLIGSGFVPNLRVVVNDEEMSDITFVNASEVRFMLQRPAQSESNAAGEPITVKAVLPTGIASNFLSATLKTFRLVVVGDSIQWGQGLQDAEKMHSILENTLANRAGHIGVYKDVKAHSGAVIGLGLSPTHDNEGWIELPGEIPSARPTILEQVDAVLGTQQQDSSVDLVLLDGGINDVGVRTILNPVGDDLEPLIEQACYDGMKALLEKTVTAFPEAQVVVTGYFQIFSRSSRNDLRFQALMAALLLKSVAGHLATREAMNRVQQRCQQFRDLAHDAINRAIDEVNADLSSTRIFFIDPNFREDHAIFAPNSLLFGISLDLSPEDNPAIAGPRAHACEANANLVSSSMVCNVVSVGHPSVAGARRYSAAINRQLPSVLPWL